MPIYLHIVLWLLSYHKAAQSLPERLYLPARNRVAQIEYVQKRSHLFSSALPYSAHIFPLINAKTHLSTDLWNHSIVLSHSYSPLSVSHMLSSTDQGQKDSVYATSLIHPVFLMPIVITYPESNPSHLCDLSPGLI